MGDIDPAAPAHLESVWDEEQSRHIATQAWTLIATTTRLDERTLRAFELVHLRGMSTSVVAATCGMSEDEVYVAKSRVARKLHQMEAQLREAYDADT